MASVRPATVLLQAYETLRCQVLESTQADNLAAPDRLLLEQQGMAAWMQGVLDQQVWFPAESKRPSPEFVQALANLVMGDRQEENDGRSR